MLARHDAPQKADELGRITNPYHEIGTGKGEDDRHLGLIGDQRIDLDATPLAVQERDHQRPLLVAGEDELRRVKDHDVPLLPVRLHLSRVGEGVGVDELQPRLVQVRIAPRLRT